MTRRLRAQRAARRAHERKLPLIAITPDWSRVEGKPSRYELNRAYADAVLVAGGLPWVTPYTDDARALEAYLEGLDGLLITGGAFDLDPADYGELRRPQCGPAKPERSTFERALLKGVLERDLPVLGVCGGMQLINVALGGSLFQDLATDLPTAISHEQRVDKRRPWHGVEVRRGTRLARAVGEGALMVNSTHHQAVHHLGEGLTATAQASDEVIEAFECAGYRFVVGVQWHPELLMLTVPANLGLYRAFVKAAARTRP
ncbi:MAG: gamma-glutamyl-gamma-aminobutyrate hydrolase family protein [Myxococcales bacterium]